MFKLCAHGDVIAVTDNRTRKTVNGVDQYAVFDAANQLIELRAGSPTGTLTHAFVYDANGNLIRKCEGTGITRNATTCNGSLISYFTWNPDDQLIGFSKPGFSESYQYDHLGRRISKTSNGTTTHYRYNGEDIDAEYTATWTEAARWVHGPNTDDPLMRLTGNTNDPTATATYYHQDGLGSVVATSGQTGNIEAAQLFDAWGNKVQSTGSIAQYGYTGREPDASGLIYYRARYYDPTLGRFISRDPAGMPDGVNRYAYVNNNPVNFTDPTGLYAKQYNTNTNTANISYTTDASSLGGIFGSGSYSLSQANRPTYDENPFGGKSGQGTKVAIAPFVGPLIGLGLIGNEIATSDVPMIGGGAIRATEKAAGQLHHIATDKAIKSGYTDQFKTIFDKAGMKLSDPANKAFLEGHAGRHSPVYHEYVLDRLKGATEGMSGSNYGNALRSELDALRQELLKNPNIVKGVGVKK